MKGNEEGAAYLTEFYIMPVEGLSTLRKELTALVDDEVARGVLFRYGYRSGYEIGNKLGIKTDLDGIDSIFEEIWWEIGLGRSAMIREGEDISISFEDSLEAKANGKKSMPSCDFTRGYLAGLLSRLLGRKYYAVEERCISMGNDTCLFRLEELGDRKSG